MKACRTTKDRDDGESDTGLYAYDYCCPLVSDGDTPPASCHFCFNALVHLVC